jgi:hypothetical protein
MLAVTILGLPLSVVPSMLEAQDPTPLPARTGTVVKWPNTLLVKFEKYPAQNTIIGVNGDGNTVYRNVAGEYFYLEPKTGDLQFISLKESAPVRLAGSCGEKRPQEVTILGIDAKGNTLQKNSRGETFYLNATCDMVFLK